MAATWLSFKVATLTAILTAVIGTMATYAMVRGGKGFGSLFQVILISPIVVPHIALAVALYLFFEQVGLDGTTFGYVLAHTVLSMPFIVFTIAAALSRVDEDLEAAAMSCGASRLTAFRQVTLPLIMPNVAEGGLFAFVISFDEPVVSFFLAGIRDKTRCRAGCSTTLSRTSPRSSRRSPTKPGPWTSCTTSSPPAGSCAC